MRSLHAAAAKRLENALALNGIPWDPRLVNTTTRRLNEQAEYWEDKRRTVRPEALAAAITRMAGVNRPIRGAEKRIANSERCYHG